jgi:[histone H3]-lysine36 N-trimethyltransferase
MRPLSIMRPSLVIGYWGILLRLPGEVVDEDEAAARAELYAAEGLSHTYVMNLQAGEVIDATKKGGLARFINHSCDPNCEALVSFACPPPS